MKVPEMRTSRNCAAFVICLLVATTGFSAGDVPSNIAVKSYSVFFEVPDDFWTVEVFDKSDVIRYSAVDGATPSVFFRLTVFRVKLPDDKIQLETSALVKDLVRDDGLRFKEKEFGELFQFRFKPETLKVPAGEAYIYYEESAVFTDRRKHYAAVALVLPNDYRTRTIGYVIVGHQIGRRSVIGLEQLEYLKLILEGLKEAPPEAPR
jgi:hypothetical protein